MATITISLEAFEALKKFAEERSVAPEQAVEMLISEQVGKRSRLVEENGLLVLDIPGAPAYTFEQLKEIEEDNW